MTTEQHILACIDGSEATHAVCDYAAWYANKLALPVSLLHVSDSSASKISDLSGAIGIDTGKALLKELTDSDEARAKVENRDSQELMDDAGQYMKTTHPDADIVAHQRHGKLLPAIEHFGERNRVIVMGRRGEDHQDSRMTIGKQIETVARGVDSPVLICSEPFVEPSSYMIAFDASETAVKATDIIAKSPLLKGLQGHIVMVGNPNNSSNSSLSAATEKLRAAGLQVEPHNVPEATAVDGLLDFQVKNDIDLIVVGAYGHSKLQQFFLGSTTSEILASTLAPVILIH